MEINDILGLPAHPLLVHVPVVLIPLAFLGSWLLLKPSWRRSFAIPVAVLALVGAAGVFLATRSGESLEERVKETDLVEDHARAGENAEPSVAVFAILAVGIVVLDHLERRQEDGSTPTGSPDGPGTSPDADVDTVASSPSAANTVQPKAVQSKAVQSKPALSRAVQVLTVACILSGAVASYMVYEAGHSGAKATWDKTPAAEVGGGEG